jgi:NAD-dependent SIR2 family protein deacetylase
VPWLGGRTHDNSDKYGRVHHNSDKYTHKMTGRGAVINGLKHGNYRHIVILTGAGVSTGAGIPDFRSPGGMYATLRPELITATESQRKRMKMDPTEVVDISLFTENQFPYLEVRRPFILGTFSNQWKPTITHYFFRLLAEKGMLRRLYSQNIDGLDLQAGVPSEMVVNVHGSLREICCEFCQAPYPVERFCHEIETQIRDIYDPNDTKASANIFCQNCHRYALLPS